MFVRIRIRSTVAADEEQQNCSQPYDCDCDYAWNQLPLTGVQVVVVVALWISWSTGTATVVSRRERWTGR
jgi:hypothetical protein